MIRVALVGARGFVGSAIGRAFERIGGAEVVPVTRDTYAEARGAKYDVVVNTAMPSGRFWAKNNPLADVTESIAKTADLFYGWKYERFVQISSVSARCQLDTVYGRHKAAAEAICSTPQSLVVRLGPMYGPTLTKGVLIDMLGGKPVFVAGESRYGFAPVEWVGEWIAKNVRRTGLVEVGARDAIALRDVAAHLGKTIEFQGAPDHQEMTAPEADFPPARAVLEFLDARRSSD